MSARPTPGRILLSSAAACLWLLAAVLLAPAVYADGEGDEIAGQDQPAGEAKDWVAELTPEEISYLEKRGLSWDRMDPLRKQRIAQAIVKLREMSPEKREELLRRVGEFAKRDGAGAFARHNRRTRISKALIDAVYSQLPPELQQSIEALGEKRRHLDMLLAEQFNKRVFELERQAALEQPLEGFPEEIRGHVRHLRERLSQVSEGDASRRARYERALVWLLIGPRLETMVQQAGGSSDDPQAAAAAVLASVEATWPAAVEATRSFLLEIEPEQLHALVEERHAASVEQNERMRAWFAFDLASSLLRRVETLGETGSSLGTQMEALARRLLIEKVGVPASRLADMPPAGQRRERGAFLQALQRELFPGMGRRGGFAMGGRPGGNGARGPGRGDRRRVGPGGPGPGDPERDG